MFSFDLANMDARLAFAFVLVASVAMAVSGIPNSWSWRHRTSNYAKVYADLRAIVGDDATEYERAILDGLRKKAFDAAWSKSTQRPDFLLLTWLALDGLALALIVVVCATSIAGAKDVSNVLLIVAFAISIVAFVIFVVREFLDERKYRISRDRHQRGDEKPRKGEHNEEPSE